MTYLWAFLVGGAICTVGQLLLTYTKMTSARVLVLFVVLGVVLTAVGIYPHIVEFAGAGATTPLTGFGYTLMKGTFEAVDEQGVLGAVTGGVKSGAAGVGAALLFGFLASIIFKARTKK